MEDCTVQGKAYTAINNPLFFILFQETEGKIFKPMMLRVENPVSNSHFQNQGRHCSVIQKIKWTTIFLPVDNQEPMCKS